MYQLKSAEKHLFNVTEDSLNLLHTIVLLIECPNGAYKLALDFDHTAPSQMIVRRVTGWTDIYLGKASVFNQIGTT